MKQIVHRAELITKVIVPKGPSVENGTFPIAGSTEQVNVVQETVAFSTTAIKLAKSLMVVMPTVPPRQRKRRRSLEQSPKLEQMAPPV